MKARTVRPVDDKFVNDHDEDADTMEESDMSLTSRSFFAQMQTNPQRCNTRQQPTFFNMENVCVFDIKASVFMRQNYSENLHSIKKTGKDLTMKQMFDMSEKLNNEVRSMKWIQLAVMILHGNKSLVGDEEVISLSHAKVYVFSASVICFGKMNQSPTSNTVWEVKLTWYKSSSQYRTLDTIDGEPMEFEWNISQDSPHCSSATKSKSSCPKWA